MRAPVALQFIGPAGAARAIAAGLPSWFVPAEVQPAVVWVDTPTWSDDARAALAGGCQVVIVDHPVVRPADVAALAGQAVVLCDDYSHTPAVGQFARQVAALSDQIDWVDVLLQGGGGCDDLWRGLATLTACGVRIDAAPRLTPSPGLVADCRAGRARVHLSAVSAGRPAATVKAFGAFGSLELRLGDPDVASPGEVWRVDAGSASLAPTEFQTSRRAALKEAYAAVTHGLALTSRLDDYALVARLRQQATGVVRSVDARAKTKTRKENTQ